MADLTQKIMNSGLGKKLLSSVGMPNPVSLRRYQNEAEFFRGHLLIADINNPAMPQPATNELCSLLVQPGIELRSLPGQLSASLAEGIQQAGGHIAHIAMQENQATEKLNALLLDARALHNSADLKQLYLTCKPLLRALQPCARIIILGTSTQYSAAQAAAQYALSGFMRSVAKEIGRKGATANLLYVAEGAMSAASAPLQFLLSAKSAYVNAQIFNVQAATTADSPAWQKPLQGKIALVTGAARGIGEAIARTLARDGAKVIGLDIPAAENDLLGVMHSINGKALLLDISQPQAAEKIAAYLQSLGQPLDILVHNAGITRDKTLANMPEHFWDLTLNINLAAVMDMTEYLMAEKYLADNGRVICVSSMNGIAGQTGQSNYASSKAGIIGYVQYRAAHNQRGITFNAVAPGFIETQMTAAIPFMTREVGRRMNSLAQGGQPVDVAETIAFFANPAAAGINGNIIRVCGQCLLGA